jgi:hypothetical protein
MKIIEKKISQVAKRFWTTHLKGKVKFGAIKRKGLSGVSSTDYGKSNVLSTEKEEDRSY